jgi:hypothetical protein
MTLVCTPVLHDNIDEVAELYEWSIRRNIPILVAPTMVSGKGLDQKEVQDEAFKTQELVSLYAKIYVMQIRN